MYAHIHTYTPAYKYTHVYVYVCSYIDNDPTYWNNVLFTDEKHFAMGMHTLTCIHTS